MAEIAWGVIGCAGIAGKTCQGIREADNALVVAVASRSLSKAEAFVDAHAPGAKPYDTYDAVLDDERVQAVYIPLPTAIRKEWVLKAAAKGKHVLCEKPLAGNVEDAEDMIKACAEAKVQFMDNTMMMHHSRLKELKQVLQAPEFGRVKHVVSCFSIPFGNDEEWAAANIRLNASLEPMGTLGDLGWYNIRISQWAFDYEPPLQVSCHYIETTAEGVPLTAHALLRYSNGRTATFDCSFKCCLRQWAEVVGQNRTVSWDDLCVTQEKEKAYYTVATAGIAENAITFPKTILGPDEKPEPFAVKGCVQHKELIRKMSALVCDGTLDADWPRISLQTQKIMMALHESAKKDGEWVKFAS
eukprot:CAMPEP_0172667604 /NCGR_PEP_ID=MMETSP1074-20121228/8538_1 /TAXON_ID=2916 /ORGANISM="Ceratium fusus, Strain PA161109" /LENGTH=356 /DNA_ID=CAMNT_0013484137 /DNA_START=44 /DNA_END=1114 /DNA_ORIENTATION=+